MCDRIMLSEACVRSVLCGAHPSESDPYIVSCPCQQGCPFFRDMVANHYTLHCTMICASPPVSSLSVRSCVLCVSLVLLSRSSLSSPSLRVVPADAGRVENEMRRELACNEDIQDVIMDLQQKHGHLAEVLQRVLKMAQM